MKLPYVRGLVLSLENKPPTNSWQSNHIDIIKLEERFYIKNSKDDLCIIKENMGRIYHHVTVILNTIILFEKYKLEPIKFFIYLSGTCKLGRNVNSSIFTFLQLQYNVNKDYFFKS